MWLWTGQQFWRDSYFKTQWTIRKIYQVGPEVEYKDGYTTKREGL